MQSSRLCPVSLVSDAVGQQALLNAAIRYAPGVDWRPGSVVTADFTCRGHKQQAILGANSTEIVVAVFINGTAHRPEVLRYAAKVRKPGNVTLQAEAMDYDPKEDPGYELPGFQRSKSFSDGDTDSAHMYWNHVAHKFDDRVH